MTVKSVIQVDVDDGAFKAFKETFDKYSAELAKQPKAWAEVGKTTKGATKGFEATTREMISQQGLTKKTLENQKNTKEVLQTQERSWRNIARDSKSVAGNIAHATLSLAKWAGITGALSGLLGAGGLYGIDRMAMGVSSGRRSSAGLGVSYGQQKAFGLNFGRYVDSDALLSGVSNSLRDVTSRGYVGLRGAGISGQYLEGHNSAEVSAELLHRVPGLFGGTKEGLIGAKLKALGLDEFLSSQDVSRYLKASPAERAKQELDFHWDASKLNLSDSSQLKWQNLENQLSRAAERVDTVFIKGLTKLIAPIDKTSQSFVGLVEAFSKSPVLEKWMGDIGAGLEGFAKYIGTPKFQSDVEGFVKNVGSLAFYIGKSVAWMANGLQYLFGAPPANAKEASSSTTRGFHALTSGGGISLAPGDNPSRAGAGKRRLSGRAGSGHSYGGDFYDAIISAEGTAKRGDPYNEVLGYGAYGSPTKPLTDMTLDEAYAFGRSVRARHGSSSALGAFQIVGKTMKEASAALGIHGNEKFSAANQRRMADWIAQHQGLGAWEGFKSHPAERAKAAAGLGHYQSLNKPQGVEVRNAAGADVNLSAYAASHGQ